MSKAFIFPGQGSQAVGMGKELADAFPEARLVFEEVDDALGQKLSKIIFEGPEDELRLTANTQPALMAVSMAVVRTLEKMGGFDLSKHARFVAGHSLGEYSALCAAQAFSIADTSRLLRVRGDAMQKAVPVGVGAMAAILGIDMAAATTLAQDAAQSEVCEAANDNAPGQVVLSGHAAAIDRAIALATERGFKRSVKLPVSAPFHCSLMQPAADVMRDALDKVTIKPPLMPVVANVTAESVSDPATIRKHLVDQVTGAVRWRESMLYLKNQGVTQVVECGAGAVLAGLMKRIDKDVSAVSLQTPKDVEVFLSQL